MASKYLLLSIFKASLFSLSSGEFETSGSWYKNSMDGINVFCRQTFKKINAAFRSPQNVDYIFVDKFYVISGLTGKKTKISRIFPKGPITVDAALYSIWDETIYLFRGRNAWGYTFDSKEPFIVKSGFPRYIGNKFKIPEVAFEVEHYFGIRMKYIIKNGKYRIWYVKDGKFFISAFGETKEFFPGIPNHLDAAISDGKFLYFISGQSLHVYELFIKKSVDQHYNPDDLFICTSK